MPKSKNDKKMIQRLEIQIWDLFRVISELT